MQPTRSCPQGRCSGLLSPSARAAEIGLSECLWALLEDIELEDEPVLLNATLQDALAQLDGVLKPQDFSLEIKERIAAFTPGTREWLIADFDNWLAQPASAEGSRAFVILAGAGMGKSCVAAKLCVERSREVAACHFCRAANADTHDVNRLIKSLAAQLARRLPEMVAGLAEAAKSLALGSLTSNSMFDALLKGPLSEVAPPTLGASADGQLVVLIDALDESGLRRNELLMLLSRRWSELPPWVRLVVTSRPDYDLLPSLNRLKPRKIESTDKRHEEDLRLHLRHLLRHRMRPEDLERGMNLLFQRSEGVFVYIAQVEARLCSAASVSMDDLAEFPEGLDGLYSEYFSEDRMADALWQKAKEVLCILLATQEPPMLSDLVWASGAAKKDIDNILKARAFLGEGETSPECALTY